MKTIWTRPGGGVTLSDHALVVDDLELRVPTLSGAVIARTLSRDDALALAAAIQAHYAETAQR